MQAVILAAGLVTRMRELTKNTPKPLLKIEDQTLLEHNLIAMPDEIDEVVLVVGYLGEQIKSLIGANSHGKKISYVEQKELKGTGHALTQCKDVLRDRFLVLMGDDLYLKKDLEKLIQYHLAILVSDLQNDDFNDSRQAVVKIDDQGNLQNIVERQLAQKNTLVNTGAYVINMDYFKYPLVPAGNLTTEFGLPQTLLQLVKNGAKVTVVRAQWWHKVTSPEDLSSRPPRRDL